VSAPIAPDDIVQTAAEAEGNSRPPLLVLEPLQGFLDAHGLGELGQRLFEMSRRGEFSRMAPLVSDEVLELFVASGTYDELPAAIERRFGGIVDTVTLDLAPGGDRKTALKLVDAIHRIPSRFERFKTQASQP